MQPTQDENYWQAAEIDEPAVRPAQPGPQVAQPPSSGPISWQASEFVHHEKSGGWFLGLITVATLLLFVDLFLIKSWTFGALIIVMAIAAIVVAQRPPRTLGYVLSAQGIQIDEKAFSFHDFRAFGVIQEGPFYSIRLIPNKRFMPMVSIYFPAERGEEIVDVLGSRLPMENIELDPIDKLVEKIRF